MHQPSAVPSGDELMVAVGYVLWCVGGDVMCYDMIWYGIWENWNIMNDFL